jgi:hypothetical protein
MHVWKWRLGAHHGPLQAGGYFWAREKMILIWRPFGNAHTQGVR